MSLTSWRTTRLNRRLSASKHPDAGLARHVVEGWLPEIESVLHAGGTAPTAFTLHDADHSFRVAERAVEIMPAGLLGRLSPVDLTFLLLASYLHDIGMTPEERRVSDHYAYLLSGDRGELSSADIEGFRYWLDDDDRGITPPMTNRAPTADDLRICSELVAHYCRFRHNDWSETWIRAHPPSKVLYGGWIEELIRLCQSHHKGKAELREPSFDPHIVDQNGQVLHLRYLACLLRVADILELDPERTPDAVFLQRDIPPNSLIYWHRDHALSIQIVNRQVMIYARPTTAVVHCAIRSLIDDIDHELQLCTQLAAEIPFKVCPGHPRDLPHAWTLIPLVSRNVEPQPGTYEYIDGAFRPNTQKLLELLSGRELYGNALAAVREMVQNAFDAVHEQIALSRLEWPDPLDADRERSLRSSHRVELRLEQRPDALWLVCADTGVGMTKSIIEKHLLVSGRPRTRELRALERRCAEAGFALGCAGHFGIGTLSYFMLGDRLQITTTRSAEARDGDSTGWSFTTEGVGSFGELRRQSGLARGSEIELRLRLEAVVDPTAWFDTLCSYLQNTLSWIPCELIVKMEFDACRSLQLQPGWIRTRQRIYASGIRGSGLSDTSAGNAEAASAAAIQALIEAALDYKEEKGPLPDGAGEYRLHLLYFDLPKGKSLGFLNTEKAGNKLHVHPIRNGNCFFPPGWASVAWRGFRVVNETESPGRPPAGRSEWASLHIPNMVIEVNLLAKRTAEVRVDRTAIQLTPEGESALAFAEAKGRALLASFCRANSNTPYALLNLRRSGLSGPFPEKLHWLGPGGGPPGQPARSWATVRYPATLCSCHPDVLNGAASFQGKPLHVLPCLRDPLDGGESCGLSWAGMAAAPDKVVLFDWTDRPRLLPVWTSNPFRSTRPRSALPTSSFPPEWKGLLGAVFERQSGDHPCVTWNRDHPLIKILRRAPVQTAPVPQLPSAALLTDRAQAGLWLLELGSGDPKAGSVAWNSLIRSAPDFLAQLWSVLFAAPLIPYRNDCLYIWRESWDPELLAINGFSWQSFRPPERMAVLEQILMSPGEDWCVQRG